MMNVTNGSTKVYVNAVYFKYSPLMIELNKPTSAEGSKVSVLNRQAAGVCSSAFIFKDLL